MTEILPDVISLLAKSVATAALDATIKPGVLDPWVNALEQHVVKNGKFSKFSVMYAPVQPPPFFWDYNCQNCTAFQEPNKCKWVEGFIARGGWCAIQIHQPGVKQFSWPARFIKQVPGWLKEAPESFKQWFDGPVPPKELKL